jgi:MFS superfamily sulfate permease-like transporter
MKTQSSSQAQNPVPGTLHVIERVIPGVRMFRSWQRHWLQAHLAYGELAGVASVAGLSTVIGAMVGYALLGRSQRVMSGTEASDRILGAIPLLLVGVRRE